MSETNNYEGAEEKSLVPFFNVLGSDGTLRVTVPEGTEGAIRREYTTSDDKTGVKFEKIYKSIKGRINNIEFFEGEYGTNLIIELVNEKEQVAKLSLNTGSNFGEDVMKKLPNVDFEQPVTFAPYSFLDDHGKNKRGMTVTQGDEKLASFFNTWDDKKKTMTNKNGYPEPKGDTSSYSKDKWKLYFTECRIFLTDYTEKYILPRFTGASTTAPHVKGSTTTGDGVKF